MKKHRKCFDKPLDKLATQLLAGEVLKSAIIRNDDYFIESGDYKFYVALYGHTSERRYLARYKELRDMPNKGTKCNMSNDVRELAMMPGVTLDDIYSNVKLPKFAIIKIIKGLPADVQKKFKFDEKAPLTKRYSDYIDSLGLKSSYIDLTPKEAFYQFKRSKYAYEYDTEPNFRSAARKLGVIFLNGKKEA